MKPGALSLKLLLLCLCFGCLPSPVAAQPTQAQTDVVDLDTVAPTDTREPDLRISAPLLISYCVLIMAGSLGGGLLLSRIRLSHTQMQTVISFVGGLMLGIGFLHLMPHAIHEIGRPQTAANWVMVGILLMFILLRLFHFHNHEPAVTEKCDHDHDHDHSGPDGVQQHKHSEGTGIEHSPALCHDHGHAHGISWAGIAFGLCLHTIIDGLALAASTRLPVDSAVFYLAGGGTFLAILLHKPLDAFSITSLMMLEGWSIRQIRIVNIVFSLMCPLGALFFVLGVQQFAHYQREILGTALAFSAGVFICISLSDLLPEMEFHSHNRVRLTVSLTAGIAIAWGLTFLEAAHLH
jgi:zinc and cadmium transporter